MTNTNLEPKGTSNYPEILASRFGKEAKLQVLGLQ